LGFVAGASENLTGPSGDGVSIAEQFKTSRGPDNYREIETRTHAGQRPLFLLARSRALERLALVQGRGGVRGALRDTRRASSSRSYPALG
jgi:hypothetical protein